MTKDGLIWLSFGALVTAAGPWLWGWGRVRSTSLTHAWFWLLLGGVAVACLTPFAHAGGPLRPLRYVALVVLATFPLAVLGAVRPRLSAWSFVLVGWLAAASLPLLQVSWRSPAWYLDGAWLAFLGGVWIVGVVNYLPTRFGLPVSLVGCALGWNVWQMRLGAETDPVLEIMLLQLALAGGAWWAWWLARRHEETRESDVDRLWFRVRNLFGVTWASRIQQQTQAAAHHAGLEGRLTWFGLSGLDGQEATQAATTRREWHRLLAAASARFVDSV